MKIAEMSWSQVEAYLRDDDRCAVPLGSVEQHANLSLAVDAILSERVAVEAAEPLGVPVFPAIAYGITPYFLAYPGSVSLRVEHLRGARFATSWTACAAAASGACCSSTAMAATSRRARWRSSTWPITRRCRSGSTIGGARRATFAKVQEIDQVASHASWMENFPWTRLAGVVQPSQRKPMIDLDRMRLMSPEKVRAYLGDGNFGGYYERPDEDMLAIWQVAVAETRALLEGPWA